MHDIPVWLLAVSLIFPRLSLLIAWFNGQIPNNDIPFIGDVLLAILIPRVLMLIYIGTNLGIQNIWFIVHLIVLLLTFIMGATVNSNNSSSNRR